MNANAQRALDDIDQSPRLRHSFPSATVTKARRYSREKWGVDALRVRGRIQNHSLVFPNFSLYYPLSPIPLSSPPSSSIIMSDKNVSLSGRGVDALGLSPNVHSSSNTSNTIVGRRDQDGWLQPIRI